METFLERFVIFFKSREFECFTPDFNPADVKRASWVTRLLVKSVAGASFGVIGALVSGEGAHSTNQLLRDRIAELSQYGELVGIYLKFGQPVIVLVVEGDELSDEGFLGRFVLIQEATNKMREFSFRIGLGGKLPARSLVFTVFNDHGKAVHFKDTLAAKCKRFSFFNKVWVLPWTVDLERKRVTKYGGLPATEFREDLLERAFFD
jgi:hypothetical protein